MTDIPHYCISASLYMNTITLQNVVPKIFCSQHNLQSEVWNKNICFEKGHTYLIEAASGTGKSTLCSYLMGYRNDYSGNILFDNQDAQLHTSQQWTEIRQKHVSMLFQELRLFPELTAWENVDIKNRITHHKTQEEIAQWFEQLDIAEKINTPVGQMSFGQQQRVAMMRALVQPFDFLLADEPVSHLDCHNAEVMAEIMMAELCRQKAGLIVTSIGKHFNLSFDYVIKL